MNIPAFFTRFLQPLKAAALISTVFAMPAVLAGCSSSNTTPFTAGPAVPPVPIVSIGADPITIPSTATLPATSTVTFTLTSPAPAGGLDVTYSITQATTPAGATPATFTPAENPEATVTIPAGETMGTVVLTVTAFPSNGATSVVTLSLVDTEAYDLGTTDTATVTIVAPDAPPLPANSVTLEPTGSETSGTLGQHAIYVFVPGSTTVFSETGPIVKDSNPSSNKPNITLTRPPGQFFVNSGYTRYVSFPEDGPTTFNYSPVEFPGGEVPACVIIVSPSLSDPSDSGSRVAQSAGCP